MLQTVRPLLDTVIVDCQKEKIESSLFVQNSANSSHAKVLAVGPGRVLKNGQRSPMVMSIGDTVIINPFSGFLYEHDGKAVRYIKAHEVLAIVSESKHE